MADEAPAQEQPNPPGPAPSNPSPKLFPVNLPPDPDPPGAFPSPPELLGAPSQGPNMSLPPIDFEPQTEPLDEPPPFGTPAAVNQGDASSIPLPDSRAESEILDVSAAIPVEEAVPSPVLLADETVPPLVGEEVPPLVLPIDETIPHSGLPVGETVSPPVPPVHETIQPSAQQVPRHPSPTPFIYQPNPPYFGAGDATNGGLSPSPGPRSSPDPERSSFRRTCGSDVLVVGISGALVSGRYVLVHILQRVFPNIVEVVHQDDFIVAPEAAYAATLGDQTQHGLAHAFDPERLRIALKDAKRTAARKGTESRPLAFVDRDHEFRPDPCMPDRVDEHSLIKRLRAEAVDVRDALIVIVEGRSLYYFDDFRRVIDVRICLLEDEGLSRGTIFGSWYLEGGRRLGDSNRRKTDRLETVMWTNSEDIVPVEGGDMRDISRDSGSGIRRHMIETIADWMIALVVDAAKHKELERRAKGVGRYEICDCEDGLLGKVRRWVIGHIW